MDTITKKDFRDYAIKNGFAFLGTVHNMDIENIALVLSSYKETGHREKLLALPKEKFTCTKSGVLQRGESKSELRLSKHDTIYKHEDYYLVHEEFATSNITILYI